MTDLRQALQKLLPFNASGTVTFILFMAILRHLQVLIVEILKFHIKGRRILIIHLQVYLNLIKNYWRRLDKISCFRFFSKKFLVSWKCLFHPLKKKNHWKTSFSRWKSCCMSELSWGGIPKVGWLIDWLIDWLYQYTMSMQTL
jgi:hypothetical protein